MVWAIVKVLPVPVAPIRHWWAAPLRRFSVSCLIAVGWSPLGLNSLTTSSGRLGSGRDIRRCYGAWGEPQVRPQPLGQAWPDAADLLQIGKASERPFGLFPVLGDPPGQRRPDARQRGQLLGRGVVRVERRQQPAGGGGGGGGGRRVGQVRRPVPEPPAQRPTQRQPQRRDRPPAAAATTRRAVAASPDPALPPPPPPPPRGPSWRAWRISARSSSIRLSAGLGRYRSSTSPPPGSAAWSSPSSCQVTLST